VFFFLSIVGVYVCCVWNVMLIIWLCWRFLVFPHVYFLCVVGLLHGNCVALSFVCLVLSKFYKFYGYICCYVGHVIVIWLSHIQWQCVVCWVLLGLSVCLLCVVSMYLRSLLCLMCGSSRSNIVCHGYYVSYMVHLWCGFKFCVFHVYCVSDMFYVLCVSLCFMFPISKFLVVFMNVSQKSNRKWNKGKITLNLEPLNLT